MYSITYSILIFQVNCEIVIILFDQLQFVHVFLTFPVQINILDHIYKLF